MAGDVSIDVGPLGPVVRPHDPTGAVVLHLHNGEELPRTTGCSTSALASAERLARATRATVVSARYRPEFPHALDDIQAAYLQCHREGPTVVAGERMGAGLAAALLVRLRDSGIPQPRCAVLVSALLDLTMESRSLRLYTGTDDRFDVDALAAQVTRYVGDRPRTDTTISPLYANLHGLPPIQLLVTCGDPLLDDSLAFAARAARDHVPVELRVPADAEALSAETLPAVADFIGRWWAQPQAKATQLLSG